MAVLTSSEQQFENRVVSKDSPEVFPQPQSSVDPMLSISAGVGGAAFLCIFVLLKVSGYFSQHTPRFEYLLGAILSIVALATTLPNIFPYWRFIWRDIKAFSASVEGLGALVFGVQYFGLALAAFNLESGGRLQEISTNLIILNLVWLVQREILNRIYDRLLVNLDPARSLGATSALYSRVEVKPGELVNCDGIVEDGVACVLERGLGPQALQRFKLKGDKLFAGTRVLQGSLRYRVEVSTSESTIVYFLAHLRTVLKEISDGPAIFAAHSHKALTVLLLIAIVGASSASIATGNPLDGILVGASLLAASGMIYMLPLFLLLRQCTVVGMFFDGALIRSAAVMRTVRRIKVVVMDAIWYFGKARLTKFQLLDNRLDQNALKLALVNIFARSDDEPYLSLCEELSREIGRVDPLNVTNFRSYKNGGVSATISGAEFSIGDEDFLIERGVYLQASELNIKQPHSKQFDSKHVWYVALQDELVGYLHFDEHDLSYAKDVAKHFGVKAKLFSAETPDNIDTLADQAGLKYDDLVLGLTPQVYREKLMTLKPVALVATKKIPERAQEFADFTIGPFNRLTFALNDWDVTFFDQSLRAAQRAWRTLRRGEFLERIISVGTLMIGVALLILGWLGLRAWSVGGSGFRNAGFRLTASQIKITLVLVNEALTPCAQCILN